MDVFPEALVIAVLLALLLSGCAEVDTVSQFKDTEYTEYLVGRERVKKECYSPYGVHDDGTPMKESDYYCGCVSWADKIVWVSRHYFKCDLIITRLHEYCHIKTGSSPEARAECDRKY